MIDPAFPSIVRLYPSINAVIPAPEEVRAKKKNYRPDRSWGAFSAEIASEGGPDRSIFILGAKFEGIVSANGQGDNERHGYFIGTGTVPLWNWVLWLCSWDDEFEVWAWCAVAAISADCSQGEAAQKLLRAFWVDWSKSQDMVAPEEVDATGILHPDIVDQIIATVFGDDAVDDVASE